jgi:hypothetical protein
VGHSYGDEGCSVVSKLVHVPIGKDTLQRKALSYGGQGVSNVNGNRYSIPHVSKWVDMRERWGIGPEVGESLSSHVDVNSVCPSVPCRQTE